eukprot:519461-Pelagomonas_calceolata.AAC.3
MLLLCCCPRPLLGCRSRQAMGSCRRSRLNKLRAVACRAGGSPAAASALLLLLLLLLQALGSPEPCVWSTNVLPVRAKITLCPPMFTRVHRVGCEQAHDSRCVWAQPACSVFGA